MSRGGGETLEEEYVEYDSQNYTDCLACNKVWNIKYTAPNDSKLCSEHYGQMASSHKLAHPPLILISWCTVSSMPIVVCRLQ